MGVRKQDVLHDDTPSSADFADTRRLVVADLPDPQLGVRAVVPIHVAIGVGVAGLCHPIPLPSLVVVACDTHGGAAAPS